MRKWFPLSGIIALLIVANPRFNVRASGPSGGKGPETQQSVAGRQIPRVIPRGGAARPIQESSFEQNIATYENGLLILGGYGGRLENQNDSRYGSAEDVSRSARTAWAPPHFTLPVRLVQSEEDIQNLLIANPYVPTPPGSWGVTVAPAPEPGVPPGPA